MNEHSWLLIAIFKIDSNYVSSQAKITAQVPDEVQQSDITKMLEGLLIDNKIWRSQSILPDDKRLKNAEGKMLRVVNNELTKAKNSFKERLNNIKSNKFTFTFLQHVEENALEFFNSNASHSSSQADFSNHNLDYLLSYTGPSEAQPGSQAVANQVAFATTSSKFTRRPKKTARRTNYKCSHNCGR